MNCIRTKLMNAISNSYEKITVDGKRSIFYFYFYKAMRFVNVLQLDEYLKQRAPFSLSSFQASIHCPLIFFWLF